MKSNLVFVNSIVTVARNTKSAVQNADDKQQQANGKKFRILFEKFERESNKPANNYRNAEWEFEGKYEKLIEKGQKAKAEAERAKFIAKITKLRASYDATYKELIRLLKLTSPRYAFDITVEDMNADYKDGMRDIDETIALAKKVR